MNGPVPNTAKAIARAAFAYARLAQNAELNRRGVNSDEIQALVDVLGEDAVMAVLNISAQEIYEDAAALAAHCAISGAKRGAPA